MYALSFSSVHSGFASTEATASVLACPLIGHVDSQLNKPAIMNPHSSHQPCDPCSAIKSAKSGTK